MAKKRGKLSMHGHVHPSTVKLEFDGDAEFENSDIVVAWLLHQTSATAPFTRSTAIFSNKRWQDARNELFIDPGMAPGIYTLMVVGNVENRPVSFRSNAVRVV